MASLIAASQSCPANPALAAANLDLSTQSLTHHVSLAASFPRCVELARLSPGNVVDAHQQSSAIKQVSNKSCHPSAASHLLPLSLSLPFCEVKAGMGPLPPHREHLNFVVSQRWLLPNAGRGNASDAKQKPNHTHHL